MDFQLITSEQEYIELKRDLNKKFGMLSPQLRNEPRTFPVVITYCFINDINGASIYLKHISATNLKKMLTGHQKPAKMGEQ